MMAKVRVMANADGNIEMLYCTQDLNTCRPRRQFVCRRAALMLQVDAYSRPPFRLAAVLWN